MIGHVKWYDSRRGFGFILDYHTKDEIFAGRHEIRTNGTFKVVGEGQPVTYEIGKDDDGRVIARNIQPLSIDDILLDPGITEAP